LQPPEKRTSPFASSISASFSACFLIARKELCEQSERANPSPPHVEVLRSFRALPSCGARPLAGIAPLCVGQNFVILLKAVFVFLAHLVNALTLPVRKMLS
jgi:hypothetical protein